MESIIKFTELQAGDVWTYAPSPTTNRETDLLRLPVYRVIETIVMDNCTVREFGVAMRVIKYEDRSSRYNPPTIINHMPIQQVWLLEREES